jgi:SAM-dependent methyltransferase
MHDPKQGEREYFARIGEAGLQHSARKPFGDEACARYLANLTVILFLLRAPPARLVEFGCGTGWLSLLLAERGYDVTGIDISPDAIGMAERLRTERGLTRASFRTADYEDVQVSPPADYVIFHDALHHAESEDAALRAAYAALGPGGTVICIEPGDGHGSSASSRRAVEEFGVHEKDMPPRKIIRHAQAAGFRRHLVLPWPWDHLRTIYRPAYGQARSLADLRVRKLLGLGRNIRRLFSTRAQGVVLLWKD